MTTQELQALHQKAMNGGLAAADLSAEMRGYQAQPRNQQLDEKRSFIFQTNNELSLREIVVSPNTAAELIERPYGVLVPPRVTDTEEGYDNSAFDPFRGKRCVNVGVDGREYVVGRFRVGLDRVGTYNFSQRRPGQWDITPYELEQELAEHKAAGKALTMKAEYVTVQTLPYTVIDRNGKVSLDRNGNPQVTSKYSLILRAGDDVMRRVAGAGYVVNDERFGKAASAPVTVHASATENVAAEIAADLNEDIPFGKPATVQAAN